MVEDIDIGAHAPVCGGVSAEGASFGRARGVVGNGGDLGMGGARAAVGLDADDTALRVLPSSSFMIAVQQVIYTGSEQAEGD